MIAVFAEHERDQTKRRTKNALSQLKKTGKVYGQIPYGWKRLVNPDPLASDDLIPDDDEQKIIEDIMFMRYKELFSYKKIVKTLNYNGIKTRTGNPWQFKQVYNIVQNANKKIAA
jgi:DNA invertase Pin-like site-specific DNA recombinase